MKWLLWILLLLNVLMLAYFNLSQTPAVVHSQGTDLHPEKIILLTQKEMDDMPKQGDMGVEIKPSMPITEAPPVVYSCYEWGSFSPANLPRARNVLTKFSLEATMKQVTSIESVRYWIYVPPLKSPEAAQAKLEELTGLGVQESFIVKEPQWRNAISLGVFKDEQLAAKLLEDLKARGVRSAVKGVRNNEKSQASLLINHVSPEMASEINKLKPDFAGSELKPVSCQ
ncbi:SPOR domain-containing protein [Methyloradius palustris]|uniref:SPOR domain-containing protein n=1 Tax=Methyloradius palustris TaxID=2778876 RepID=A0A8D5K1E8_9PROT|nr:SPOR domain-containing protein [Methyloradius palustris]BCM25693.1 hypothetical protein ZMTM_19520 [Methyloradius palustris]